MKNNFISAPLLLGASAMAFCVNFALAQSNQAESTDIESITIVGTRQAYQGDFATLEIPQADLSIDLETLQNAGAIDLVQALDLSASVARQNNFGGLWNLSLIHISEPTRPY